MDKKKDHLPFMGVGPVYAAVVIALTVVAVLCRDTPALEGGRLASVGVPLTIAGIILIAIGAVLWFSAVVVAKLDANIARDQLVTTGIFAWVRNPVYSAFMIACTGVLLIVGNAWFLILPFVYWLFMTVLMKRTEEIWLQERFGREYEAYRERVNRCWPWFPRKG